MITLREILENPSNGAMRVVFDYQTMISVVKIFDPDLPKDYVTVKFFLNPNHYEATKHHWNTIKNKDGVNEVVLFTALVNLKRIVDEIRNISEGI